LDKRRYLPIDIAHSGDTTLRHIPIHNECVFFATANLGSEYSGTTQIDRALLDRFFPIELTYPNEAAETKILQIRTGVDERTAKAIVKVSKTIREQFKAQELSNVISVRHTLIAASLVKDGFDTVAALTKVILPLFEEGDGSASERTKIKAIIAAR
jgi:MoxR-like ATPase